MWSFSPLEGVYNVLREQGFHLLLTQKGKRSPLEMRHYLNHKTGRSVVLLIEETPRGREGWKLFLDVGAENNAPDSILREFVSALEVNRG